MTSLGACAHCGLPAPAGAGFCCLGCELASEIRTEERPRRIPAETLVAAGVLAAFALLAWAILAQRSGLEDGARLIDVILASLGLGFAGGVHCAAMCGPIAAAGCSTKKSAGGYLLGRLLSYAFFGALFGAFGEHLVHRGLGTVQHVALVSLAVILFGRGLLLLRRPKGGAGLVQLRRRSRFASLLALVPFPKRGLGLGLVTGMLPCGLLFAGWALAAGSADPLAGALAMLSLGVASLPGLLVPVAFSRFVGAKLSPARAGLLWVLLGVFVAVRPLLETVHCASGQ